MGEILIVAGGHPAQYFEEASHFHVLCRMLGMRSQQLMAGLSEPSFMAQGARPAAMLLIRTSLHTVVRAPTPGP